MFLTPCSRSLRNVCQKPSISRNGALKHLYHLVENAPRCSLRPRRPS